MAINDDSEKRFEADIEAFLLSQAGGYVRNETLGELKIMLTRSLFLSKTQVFYHQ